jgi:hypothetical protein
MELLDSEDPVKGQLLRKSALHREQLEEDVKIISERTEKIITNALIIGGALAATYFIVSQFSGSKSKKSKLKRVRLVKDEESADQVVVESAEPEAPGVLSQVGTALASQATVLLLTFAKEKLSEFMQAQNDKKVKSNDNS